MPPEKPSESRSFKSDDPKYATDTFSRGDREGAPSKEVLEEAINRQAELDAAVDQETLESGGGTSSVEATPDAESLKPADDADSRDATPHPPTTGGVT